VSGARRQNANAEPCLGGDSLTDGSGHEAAARGHSAPASDLVDADASAGSASSSIRFVRRLRSATRRTTRRE
jgi:hypothetical protein